MNNFYICVYIFSVTISYSIISAVACKGCLNLDEYNFDKIIPRFEAVLVKFDVAYPYGDKHEVFNALATEVVDNKNFILAEVSIKDYGEKENEEFSKRFGINSKDDLPTLRLFVNGEDEPFAFEKNIPWNNENLKTFIRDHSNIYLGLPGCLEEFDKLAFKFGNSNNKKAVLEEAESAASKLQTEKEQEAANIYIKFMNKVIEVGNSFTGQEKKRLEKILSEGKVAEKKKRELFNRLNVLKSFNLETKKVEL
ncbi:protein windbeutel [Diorhabda carinulata]|uniref:protein windbeutel n=1 Tax=Diorhabda carinulata TaxID=1163345 RepID=UPI0025A27836|nr:protein windbeutel [Diorhabda carinulata]